MGGRLFNARSETASSKPSFRAAFRKRRCLVVADGFYEWTPRSRDHQPHHFRARSGGLLGMAGLYEHWLGPGGESIDSCTVLTTDASEDVAGVHHRMPVLLPPGDFAGWLDPDTAVDRTEAFLHPADAGTLVGTAVTRRVNSPRFDAPECLLPDPDEGGERSEGGFVLDGGRAG